MKKILSMLSLTAVFMFAACGGGEPKTQEGTTAKAIDYDKMAQGFCTCMRPMFEFQEKVLQLSAEGKDDEIKAMQEEAMKVQETAAACVESLEAEYGVVEGEEAENKATESLKKACPDIMAMMSAGAEAFEE